MSHLRVDRRRFLAASAAACAGACVSLPRARAAESEFAGLPMGMQTYTFRGFDTLRALDETKNLGLGYVEMFDAQFPHGASDAAIAEMLGQAKQRGIQIVAHGVNPMTKDHEANRRYFDFAKKAGIPTITADPTEDSFDSLDKLVAEYDIRIAIHNHGPGARYDKVADVLTAIEGHHPHIGACADLGHYIRSAEDPVRAIRLFKGRLYGVHLKDFADQKAETRGVILGQGHLDVRGVFAALKEVEFPADGALSLEYEENPDNPVADVKACLEAAREGARGVS